MSAEPFMSTGNFTSTVALALMYPDTPLSKFGIFIALLAFFLRSAILANVLAVLAHRAADVAVPFGNAALRTIAS
jgi:hypothetical protein